MLSAEKQAEIFTEGFALQRTTLTSKEECVAWRMGWEVRRVIDRFFEIGDHGYVPGRKEAVLAGIKIGVQNLKVGLWYENDPLHRSGVDIGAMIRRHNLDALQSLLHGG